MNCPARPIAPTLRHCAAMTLLGATLLCAACSDDGSTDTDATGTDEGDTGNEPIFVPPTTVLIPEGNVWRGCLEGDSACDSNENPGGMIAVSAFFIMRYEATVAEYEACVDAGMCNAPPADPDCNYDINGRDDYPVNCVNWNDAHAYCSWLGLRLPTEAEWERAARGDSLSLYPWGDDAPTCTDAVLDTCFNGTQPVGTLPDGISPFGIGDMVGNVSEWVGDYYDPEYYAASAGEADPQGPDTGSMRVVKGSAFTVAPSFPANRISKRNPSAPDAALRIYGIRCARDR